MKMKKPFIAAVLCLASIIQSSGCKSAQVAFPGGSDKTAFEQYDVQGRRDFALFSGNYKFGPYSVDWTRGFTTGESSENSSFFDRYLTVENSEKYGIGKNKDTDMTSKNNITREAYTVSVTGSNGVSWKGDCRSEAEKKTETIKINKKKSTSSELVNNKLVCIIKSSDKQSYELFMSQSGGLSGSKSGSVKGKIGSFEINNTRRLEGAAWDINRDAGYLVTESGKLVAVVDVTNEGKVYIAKGLGKSKTSLLVAVSAVLLGYRDMSE